MSDQTKTTLEAKWIMVRWRRVLGHLAGWFTRCVFEAALIAIFLKWIMHV